MASTNDTQATSILDRPLAAALCLNVEKALYLALIVLALVSRFYDLGARVMSHDESLHTQYSWYLVRNGDYKHDPMMHGPLKFEVTAFVYWLLGDNDYTSRIPTAVMGVAAVGLMYFFRKWLGRAGALAGAVMMLISPYMLYYSRYIRDEMYMVVWGMLTALCVLNYLDKHQPKYLYWLTAVTALFYCTMEASFIYIAIVMLFLGIHLLRELFSVSWPQEGYRQQFIIALVVAAIGLVAGLGLLLAGHSAGTLGAAETATPATPGATSAAAAGGGSIALLPKIGVWSMALGLAALAAAAVLVFRAFGEEVRRLRVLDLLMVFGLFVLPQLSAFVVHGLGIVIGRPLNPIDYSPIPFQPLPVAPGADLLARIGAFFGNLPIFFNNVKLFLGANMGITSVVVLILLAVSVWAGLAWDRQKFLVCAVIFYGIYIPVYTTFFTNAQGLATGLVGSLGYWLEQHGVERGSQPLYYYLLINLPIYEFLPTLGALFTGGLALARRLSASSGDVSSDAHRSGGKATDLMAKADTLPFPAIGYFGFWAVMAVAAFSIAGEKMPWLTTHMALPLILTASWGIGQLIDGIEWRRFYGWRAWAVWLLTLITLLATLFAVGRLLGSNPPFQGSQTGQNQATMYFLMEVALAVLGIVGIYYLGEEWQWQSVVRLGTLTFAGILALLTARAAFVAAYINYDYANEFLVYAHGARGIKTVMKQIEEISQRTTDELKIKAAYDDLVAWPMTWYFRNYTNQAFYGAQPTREALDAPVVVAGESHWSAVERILENNYYQFEYVRMVWPMQDYFADTNPSTGKPDYGRTFKRFWDAILQKDMRQALWNIWYNRDYKKYAEVTAASTGRDVSAFDLSKWLVADRMRFYVRKDVAAMTWRYGVGPAAPVVEVPDPCEPHRQLIPAETWWGTPGTGNAQFTGPRGVAVGPDGSVYVADTRNHRIQKFSANGEFLLAWGSPGKVENGTGGPGKFNEPWGIAVDKDGAVYVADLWNYRIQKFDASGNFLAEWGHAGIGQTEDPLGFWGPRGVAVDGNGQIYISDTGNKRIIVLDKDGKFVRSIGSGGAEPGQLDEPVGLAVTADGSKLYVADTWNRRVQRFDWDATANTYVFGAEVPMAPGWKEHDNPDNKPYMALDSKGRLYVAEPDGSRVKVYDGDGQCVLAFGDFGSDASTFNTVAGVAVGPDDSVYVVDYGNSRVMKFAPLP